MADAVKPVLTATGCKQQLPSWGVTREFRFGQFVQLYDERLVQGKRQVTPLKLNSDGDITELSPVASSSAVTSVPAPPPAMPLQALAAANFDEAAAGEPQTTIEVADVEGLIRSGVVELGPGTAQVELGPETVSALRSGEAVQTLAYANGWEASVVRLQPMVEDVQIDAGRLDGVLAQRTVESGAGTVRLDDVAMRDLIEVGETIAPAWRRGQAGALVHVVVRGDGEPVRPAAERIAIEDLTEFLAAPVIPATDGQSLVVDLDEAHVRALRLGDAITLPVGERQVTLKVIGLSSDPPGPGDGFVRISHAYVLDDRYTRYDLGRLRRDLFGALTLYSGNGAGGGAGAGGDSGPGTQKAPNLSRTGMPVAILLPWKQTWTLTGFSRGNLLSSLALAPGEETRITVSSWERRAKALTQTAETDIEQTFDFTSTTRDTEDVFREMVQTNEFSAQAHASLDASYALGGASITLGAGGEVSNAGSLVATTRTATQHVRESTSRASTRVRARRITTIAESMERTAATETIRTIRNPNPCHTLTLNFHEVLAHYKVKIEFNEAAVRIVVLVPNPHHVKKFDELAVRVHEATLRVGLLDAALVDGFEACRLLEAYARTKAELETLGRMSKQERDLDREREKRLANEKPKPVNPYLAPMTAILKDLRGRFAPFPAADVMPALRMIAGWNSPTAPQLLEANRWLWRRLVAAKFGTGLLDALASIPGAPGPDDARRVAAAVPPMGSFPTLEGLGALPDKDKDDAGLYSTVATNFTAAWWWWYPRLKDGRMYDVVDGGLAGVVAKLATTFRDWEAKEAEGEGMQQAAAVVEQAKNEQQQLSLADRLEMKFGAETVGAASERSQALLAHLNEHVDYYRYVLFQGMPPSEQMRRLMDVAPQLRIGTFEPHVVASDGPNLAVPLTPLAETTLAKAVANLSKVLKDASAQAQAAGDRILEDDVILTTPGVSVESWRGDCSGCDDDTQQLRAAEVRRAVAEAELLELEAARRKARLEAAAPLLDDPGPPTTPRIEVRLLDES